MTSAKGTFRVQSWQEHPYLELDGGAKLTRASVEQGFAGDIVGGGAVEWLMAYRPDGTADFVGMQTVTGTIGGRAGGFVVRSVGSFDGGIAEGAWSVVVGSGTRDLAGLRGHGGFRAPLGPEATYELDYTFG